MIRQEERGRLISYARALGVTVYFRERKDKDPAASCSLDATEIIIYERKNEPQTTTILSIIHELGHVLTRKYSKKSIDSLLQSITICDKAEETNTVPPIADRRAILRDEIDGVRWWPVIIKDCNIKITHNKIKFHSTIDIWIYRYFYTHGIFPNKAQYLAKQKEVRLKLKQSK